MVFGGVSREQIQLNEDTLWSGDPHAREVKLDIAPLKREVMRLLAEGKYAEAERLTLEHWQGQPPAAYQPFGDLWLDFDHGGEEVADYQRLLDLDTAVATTRYRIGSADYRRDCFVSAPADMLVLHLSCSERALCFSLDFTSPHPYELAHDGGMLTISGQAPGQVVNRTETYIKERNHQKFYPAIWDETGARIGPFKTAFYGDEVDSRGMHFCGKAHMASDGTISVDGNRLTVSDASECVIRVSLATSYAGRHEAPSSRGDIVADQRAAGPLVEPCAPYETLLAEHVRDYQSLFRRSDITVGEASEQSRLPTDERIRLFANGNDMELVGLYYQFGRYLMISGSRPGSQALNLQGIWNDQVVPPWFSAYTVNINTQMNYWPAESANLSECHEPLMRFITGYAEDGAQAAEKMYHCRGWVTSHNADVWRSGQPIEGPSCCFWQGGAGWLCQHLWTHYVYTRDLEFLRAEAYPAMRGAAEFYLDWMVEDEHGRLVTPISESPESRFVYSDGDGVRKSSGISVGCTMDMTLIAELFTHCIAACETLSVDADFKSVLEEALTKIEPFTISPGGYLQEWREDFKDEDIHHRHVSHLYGLYPGQMIAPETPALFAAARRSLERRGDMATGWSIGWKINLWARLLDGNRALTLIKSLISPERTYPNMFDAHPPFQIDGNFGATAGLIEMLVQYRAGTVHVLPALPDAWHDGAFRGICCPGGIELDAAWKGGRVTHLTLKTRFSDHYRVAVNDTIIEVDCRENQSRTLIDGAI
jgi:alpha-L-fucosidase 2